MYLTSWLFAYLVSVVNMDNCNIFVVIVNLDYANSRESRCAANSTQINFPYFFLVICHKFHPRLRFCPDLHQTWTEYAYDFLYIRNHPSSLTHQRLYLFLAICHIRMHPFRMNDINCYNRCRKKSSFTSKSFPFIIVAISSGV